MKNFKRFKGDCKLPNLLLSYNKLDPQLGRPFSKISTTAHSYSAHNKKYTALLFIQHIMYIFDNNFYDIVHNKGIYCVNVCTME